MHLPDNRLTVEQTPLMLDKSASIFFLTAWKEIFAKLLEGIVLQMCATSFGIIFTTFHTIHQFVFNRSLSWQQCLRRVPLMVLWVPLIMVVPASPLERLIIATGPPPQLIVAFFSLEGVQQALVWLLQPSHRFNWLRCCLSEAQLCCLILFSGLSSRVHPIPYTILLNITISDVLLLRVPYYNWLGVISIF